MHRNKYPEDTKDEVDDIYEEEDNDTLLSIPEESAVDEPVQGEYWEGLPTLEPVTPRQNVPPPSAPPSPQVPPSRWARGGPSRSGRVAYVLFGGLDDEPGLYHNWDSLAAVLACYQNGFAPAYIGSNTEEEAITQYRHYKITGEIPFKVRIYHKIVLLNGLVVGVNPPPPRVVPSPQASRVPPTQASPTPHVGARRNPAHLKPTPQVSTPHSTPDPPLSTLTCSTPTHRRAKPLPHSPSPSPAISPAAERGRLYYVVLKGYTPGVYNTHHEAIRAAGPFSGGSISTSSTRASANQMFVDGFMTSRVSVPLSSSSSSSGR